MEAINSSYVINKAMQGKTLLYLLLLEVSILGLTLYDKIFGLFILVLLTCAALFFIIEKKPEYSIIFIIFSILLGPISTIPLKGKIPQLYFIDVVLSLAFFILLLKYLLLKDTFSISFSFIELLFLVFILYSFVTILQSIDFFRGLASLRNYLMGWFVFGLVLRIINNQKQIEKLFWMLMIWGVCLSLIEIYSILSQGNILLTVITKNVHLSWGKSNYIASFYALLIPLGVSILFTKNLSTQTKLLLMSFILLMITSIFLTGSRGGVVALAIGFLVLLWRFRSWQTLVAFLFFCFLVGVVIFFNPSSQIIWQRLVGYQTSPSVFSRIELWTECIKIFKESPILGVGLGNVNYHMKLSGALFVKAHNLILELLSETGIIGFIIFAGLFYKVFRIQIENCINIQSGFQDSLAWGILAGTIAVFSHSMVEPNISSYQFSLVFWTVIGISVKQEEFRKIGKKI